MPRSYKLSSVEVQEILREYKTTPYRVLADRYRVTENAIYHHVHKAGLSKPRGPRSKRSGQPNRYRMQSIRGRELAVHRVALCEYFGIDPLKLPPTVDVHHRDLDEHNNSVGNLMFMTRADHMALHRGGMVDLEQAESRAMAILHAVPDILDFLADIDA